jgi:hypothetical protein
MFNDDIQGHDNWVTSLRKFLQSHGFGYVWESQSVTSEKYFIAQFVNRLKDVYQQEWHSSVTSNVKLSF